MTTKPAAIGSSSSELAQTPGVRLLNMAEISKGSKLEEGTMKLFSGGDQIQARQLFQESKTFTPQFKMILQTNFDFEITANDDGTWRRLRYITFASKFVEKPYEGKYDRAEHPYQYPRDENISDKFNIWAPVLLSMLAQVAFKTEGIVKDCQTVLKASESKRENNDYLAAFARDKVRRKDGKHIKKTELLETFKQWYLSFNPGSKTIPKGKEIVDYMTLKYGECSKNGWKNVEIIYNEEDD